MDIGKIDPEVHRFLQYNKRSSTKPTKARQLPLEVIDRLATRFAINENGCWVWKTPLTTHSYQNFGGVPAHRFMYELIYGELIQNEVVDHLCHVASCINPKHLDAVTMQQNNEKQVNRIQISYDRRKKLDILVKEYNRTNELKVTPSEYTMSLIDKEYESGRGLDATQGGFGKATVSIKEPYYELLRAWSKGGKRTITQQLERVIQHYQLYMDGQDSTENYDDILESMSLEKAQAVKTYRQDMQAEQKKAFDALMDKAAIDEAVGKL